MQLILLVLLLLAGGKSGKGAPSEIFDGETMELIKSIGGGEVEEIFKEAEQVSEIITAFNGLMSGKECETHTEHPEFQGPESGFPLKPIANIADDSIYNALARAL